MILCYLNMEFSYTDPRISPPVTMVPIWIFGSGFQSHFFALLSAGTSTPLGTKTEWDFFAMTSRGLWIPSKISWRIPGPSWTESGCFVLMTGSPTVNPEVSS